MKKLLTLIILTLCVIFVFSACGGNDTPVDTSTDTGTQGCNHSATTTIEGYAPTCTKTGLTDGKKCVSCGAIIVKQETISKVSHTFSSVIKIESSCGSSESYSAKICKDCGYFESNLQETVLHPHSFEYYTREATCTLEGIKAGFKCKNCNYIATEIRTEALGHSYDDNYTPNGSNHYAVCQRCGDKKESSHVCKSFTTVKEPNCFEKGRKVGVCTLCDGVVEEDIPIKHSWNNGAVTTEATCISKGDRLYTCTICGETKTEVIYEKSHPYDDGVTTKEPTCTETGSKLYTCTYCTGTKTETISALGHNWDNGTTIEEPTCVKAGSKLHTCKRCSETKIEPVSALGHNWDSGTTTVEANCYQTGNIHYLCQRCDAEKDKIVPKLHSFDKGTTLQEASCTQEGKVRYTCTICSAKYDVTLGVKHNTTHTQRVENTCTEDGNIEYWQCNDCEKYFSYVTSDYASFEYDGRQYYNTSTYSYTYTETKSIVLKAKGHKYPSIWSYDSTQHYYLCKNGCGTKNSETNHIFEEKYALERKDDGSQYIYSYNKLSACKECYYSKVIDSVEFAHVHYDVEEIEGADPTCTQSGLTYGLACGVCDEIYIEQETIPAFGHNYVNSICTRCGLNSKLGTVGLTYELNSDGTAYICTGIGTATTPFIVIGSEYKGLPVTEIKANAFMGNYNIVSVVIPTTIKAIGDSAFYDCHKLVEVYNLSSLTVANDTTNGYVGNYALDIYTDLSTPSKLVTTNKGYIFYLGETNYLMGYVGNETELVFPNMFAGKEYSIYKYAFYFNIKITSITIGLKTKALGVFAFDGCAYLTEINFNAIAMDDLSYSEYVFANAGQSGEGIKVTIGKNVTKIPAYLFSPCLSSSYSPKITSVEFEEGSICKSIGNGAFKYCTPLTSVTIPNSVTSIGIGAFDDCDSLVYNEYDNGYYLGNESNPYLVLVKAKDTSITSCTIHENTKIICYYAFDDCASLTSITIPSSVTSIGYGAFFDCTSLTSITIPDSITSIGSDAFTRCYKLVEVYNLSSLDVSSYFEYAKIIHTSLEEESILEEVNGYIFMTWEGKYYLMGYIGSDTELTLPESYNGNNYEIYLYAFYERDDITKVTIPDSVTSIGFDAFYDCDSLTSVTIGNSVTTIGSSAFSGCDSLISVTIGNGVTSIGDYAFYGCTSLTSVTIGNGVTSIGGSAFENCTSLTSVVVPDSVTSIENYTFYGCTSLTSITIPNSVKSIEYGAFYCCISLTSITIPNGVTSIGSSAFFFCTALTSITIPDSVTSIGEEAFYGCTSLTSVVVPDSVTSIGEEAFRFCTSLTSVVVPDSVTSIENYTFYGCTSLTSITIPNSVTWLGSYAFQNCYKLVEVYNLSSLNIEIGSENNGYVGYFAKVIHTSLEEESILETVNNYIFMTWEDKYYLIGYVGSETEITLPESYNGNNYEVYEYAFHNNKSITKVTIGNGVTLIGYRSFDVCTSLASVIIGDRVTSIGAFAFYNCYSLTSITIPNSVTSIENTAFLYCYKLIEVYNLSSLDISDYGNAGYYAKVIHTSLENESIIHTTQDGYVFAVVSGNEIYLVDYIGNETELTLPECYNGNNYEIYWYAFYKRNDITKVIIPSGVTSIGYEAFSGCDSLTSITIGNSVTSIGYWAFYNCSSLTSVIFENTNGWYVTTTQGTTSGTDIGVTNASTAATYLTSTYYDYYWYRK
ncbi:MAG: leucine-rich repeat protein [Clostridia bacterium]|nr:leucine-rich repeat protein [Clostridia bacterium]